MNGEDDECSSTRNRGRRRRRRKKKKDYEKLRLIKERITTNQPAVSRNPSEYKRWLISHWQVAINDPKESKRINFGFIKME